MYARDHEMDELVNAGQGGAGRSSSGKQRWRSGFFCLIFFDSGEKGSRGYHAFVKIITSLLHPTPLCTNHRADVVGQLHSLNIFRR